MTDHPPDHPMTSFGKRAGVSSKGRTKRSDRIAEEIRDLIITRNLQPGDRLPSDWQNALESRVARGTMREAMKALETQGLIKNRTGPGGGPFVTALSGEKAIRLVSNLFVFQQPSISDIYALRRLLEPELVADLAGQLDETALRTLQETIRLYDHEPATAKEEFDQRMAELDFHSLLAGQSENGLVAFICIFLHTLLRDIAVCREIYEKPNPELREVGLKFQLPLLRLLRKGDGEAARRLMRDHMVEAESYMLERARTARATLYPAD